MDLTTDAAAGTALQSGADAPAQEHSREPALNWPGSPADGADFLASPRPFTGSIFDTPPADWKGRVVEVPLAHLLDLPGADAAWLFLPPSPERSRDPRQADNAHVVARLHDSDAATRFGALWGSVLARGGACGAVLGGWNRLPEWSWEAILSGLRDAAPDIVLIADTAGVDRALLGGLSKADALTIALPHWNGADGWLSEELDALRAVAPPVARLTLSQTAHADRDRALARALGLPSLGTAHPAATLSDVRILSAPGARVLVTLGTEGDPRYSPRAEIHLVNPDPSTAASVDPAGFLPYVGGEFAAFTNPADGAVLTPGRAITLAAAGASVWQAKALDAPARPPLAAATARKAAQVPRAAIEAVTPSVDGGLFPVKRIAGESVTVEADLICDGHDKLSGAVLWRKSGVYDGWQEVALAPLGNDRWQARFPLLTNGLHEFTVLAWRDAFETFRDEVFKKHQAGVPTALELQEGAAQVEAARARHASRPLGVALKGFLDRLVDADEDAKRTILLSPELATAMRAADDRPGVDTSRVYTVDAERTGAAFASWYEIFPRSMSDDVERHGSFADVERHLPRIAAMGFDVLYFPPIHPIGRVNRKGRNNTLTPDETDPGSPYAIGSDDGGHDALHPELGTLEDFLHLRGEAAKHGLELAIDFAIQCSPDHPWLREHRDWFAWRPDGSIRYAENPPKKYQDIVNVDFYAPAAIPDLWLALGNVVLFWAEQGVRLFRVDNPHTKPFAFWQWLIAEVRSRYPDASFLAEAFTRPKVMNRLAKVGFSQSYTYFTWRNTRPELEEYLTQLTQEAPKDFFRPNFFVNTPDINPTFLQTGGRTSHLIRAALAATLSGLWGVYSGFELCEATPLAPGKEEYLDSEKYQLRAWDWERPGNIVDVITRLNHARTHNPALRRTAGVAFLPSSDPAVIAYEKATDARDNVIVGFVSLDPFNTHDTTIELPLTKSGLPADAHVEIEDVISGVRFGLDGARHSIRLTPEMPFILWRLV